MSGGGAPYIGSHVYLTTNSEIRYEGTICHIDPAESTVALQNVRSFGTEGRRRDGPQVPPHHHVFEFVRFRASDIKDLKIIPKAETMAPPADPAIVSSRSRGPATQPKPSYALPTPQQYSMFSSGSSGGTPWNSGSSSHSKSSSAAAASGRRQAAAPATRRTATAAASDGTMKWAARVKNSTATTKTGRSLQVTKTAPAPKATTTTVPGRQIWAPKSKAAPAMAAAAAVPTRTEMKSVTSSATPIASAIGGKKHNKKKSFFDEISCNQLDRAQNDQSGRRQTYRARVAAENRVNLQTFGAVSAVDQPRNNNYRGRRNDGNNRGGRNDGNNRGGRQYRNNGRGRGGYRGSRSDQHRNWRKKTAATTTSRVSA